MANKKPVETINGFFSPATKSSCVAGESKHPIPSQEMLPPELILTVFRFVHEYDRFLLLFVCREWFEIAKITPKRQSKYSVLSFNLRSVARGGVKIAQWAMENLSLRPDSDLAAVYAGLGDIEALVWITSLGVQLTSD